MKREEEERKGKRDNGFIAANSPIKVHSYHLPLSLISSIPISGGVQAGKTEKTVIVRRTGLTGMFQTTDRVKQGHL